MGPPTATPKTFRISSPGTLGRPCDNSAFLLNQLLATAAVLRLYSYTLPWSWLVPLLVNILTCAPDERPASALALVVVTRNSSTESSVERKTPVKANPFNWSLSSTPSSVTLV